MIVAAVCEVGLLAGEPAAKSDPALDQFLSRQASVKTWAADFTQTRALKALSQPLVSTGKVWFASPGYFRWEVGQPAQTIAVRGSNAVALVYPRLKRVEHYSLEPGQQGPWKDALALLEAGFPRSRQELNAQFEVLSQGRDGEAYVLKMRPRSVSARRLMSEIDISFNPSKEELLSTKMVFADGSSMRNDFTNQTLNPPLEPALFSTAAPDDFKVVKPLEKPVKGKNP